MNITISIIVIFLFILVCYLTIKNKYNQTGICIALILIVFDLITHFSAPEYHGIDLNSFSNTVMADIAIFSYYIGYHLVSIIGLIISYIFYFINTGKNKKIVDEMVNLNGIK